MYDIAYNLALLLVEMERHDEAVPFLESASAGMPERGRIHYNLGLLYQQQQNIIMAESKLRQALETDPQNLEFQYGLADHYIKRGLFTQALPVVELMVQTHPEEQIGMQMMNFIRQRLQE